MVDKFGMVDKLLVMLDQLSVSGAKNVIALSQALQMANTLRKGLKEEDEAKKKIIDGLKMQLEEKNRPEATEDGLEVVGGQHYEIDLSGKS